MLQQKKNNGIYCEILRGSRGLLADERNKKYLLDLILKEQSAEERSVYAFCVTDECAYFITEAEDAGRLCEESNNTARAFLRHREDCFNWTRGSLTVEIERELHSMTELMEDSRRLHRIPLEKGYVRRIRDYWWSSYITYIGGYEWNIDSLTLLRQFSIDPGQARRKLARYHTQIVS